MEKPQIIFIEGSQGVGKTTVANLLRENMPYTNLLRLSGIKDKTEEAQVKIHQIHKSILRLLAANKECGMNYILDRSFMSEKVYCNLGYKPYDFISQSFSLMHRLKPLTKYYDIHFIVLTASEEEFYNRLNREKPTYSDVEFDYNNSMLQQEEYIKELKVLENEVNDINCHVIDTTNKDICQVIFKILYEIN